MQDLSFTPINVVLPAGRLRMTVSVYTFENVYTLSPESTEIKRDAAGLAAECTKLLWAGGQEELDGLVSVRLTPSPAGWRVRVSARMPRARDTIRCVKVAFSGLEAGRVINGIDVSRSEIGPDGLTLTYPEGWRECGTPLVIIQNRSGYLFLRSLDDRVRKKMFVFYPEEEGRMTAELIFEEDAVHFSNRIEVPEWEIGERRTIEEIYNVHIEHIKKAYGLKSWDEREDVPDWARRISLVASIHGQHWTGKIFNDYAAMQRAIGALAKKLDGDSILAYLPGWEGRYYWQYGDYRPDERMGGEKDFRRLCDSAREMGVHLMPMFGMTHAGKHLEGYQRWGVPSEWYSPSGNQSNSSVDWDGARHFDHSSNGSLNPGAPQWQNRLCGQIEELIDEYRFEAVFLDILAAWVNDPNFNAYEGVRRLTRRLKAGRPNLLIAGEAWYDGLMALVPLLQSGHTDGRMHYHDTAYPGIFDPFEREFGHLCLGDPAFHSTGVHEKGWNEEWRTPLKKGVIPTITIVDGTMEMARDRVDDIVEQAKQYRSQFITGERAG